MCACRVFTAADGAGSAPFGCACICARVFVCFCDLLAAGGIYSRGGAGSAPFAAAQRRRRGDPAVAAMRRPQQCNNSSPAKPGPPLNYLCSCLRPPCPHAWVFIQKPPNPPPQSRRAGPGPSWVTGPADGTVESWQQQRGGASRAQWRCAQQRQHSGATRSTAVRADRAPYPSRSEAEAATTPSLLLPAFA